MMAQQLDMFGAPPPSDGTRRPERRKRVDRPSIDQRFAIFHKANPHVFDEMLRLAVAKLERGERRIGVKALWEELRASFKLNEAGPARGPNPRYKLDNGYTAIYARQLIAHEPRLAEVIELRKRKAKR